MPTVRIVIADDHGLFRDGLRRLLEAEPGLQVVGEAATGEEALDVVAALKPDVLLLDLAMPGMSGLDVLRALDESHTVIRTVLLTAAIDPQQIADALTAGARGLLLKHVASPLLYKCVHAVAAGQYWIGHDRLPGLIDALRRAAVPPAPSPAESLTRRELRIVAAIVEGATNRDVAQLLGLSEQTVKNHVSHIFDKLGVSNRLELALYAIHHKLLDRIS